MTNDKSVLHINSPSVFGELTQKDIDAAIRTLKYRKLYNARPDVKEARRRYNQRRMETVRTALKVVREHPELLKEEGE